MDWGVVSAVAQVIAAVAVVVSLIYLAVQIRDNTKHLEKTIQATRTQSAGSMLGGFDRWRDMILDQENSDIWIRGLNDLGSLRGAEKLKFNTIASACIWSCWYKRTKAVGTAWLVVSRR